MGGFLAAWLTGEAIYAWRSVRVSGKPPVPGAMLGISGLFMALAALADTIPAARFPATALAWGLDVAALMNVLPAGLGGEIKKAQASSEAATAPAGGGARPKA